MNRGYGRKCKEDERHKRKKNMKERMRKIKDG